MDFGASVVKIMVERYSKVGTQPQNKSISGSQQEKGWEPLIYKACPEWNLEGRIK